MKILTCANGVTIMSSPWLQKHKQIFCLKKKTSDGENQSFIIKSMCGKSSRSKSTFVENKISINFRGRLPYCLRRKNKFLTWPFLFISCSFTLSKGRPLKVFINWVQMRSSLHALLLQKHNFKEDQGHNMQLISQQSSHFASPRWPIDLPVLQAIFPSKQTSKWLRPRFCTTCATKTDQ